MQQATMETKSCAASGPRPRRPGARGRACRGLWCGLLAAALLAWAGAAAAAAGDKGDADDDQPDHDDPDVCVLAVHGTVSDGAARLRLAAPPFDLMSSGAGGLAAMFYGLLGAEGMQLMGAASNAWPGTEAFTRLPTPTVRRLIDGSADLLAGRQAAGEKALNECVQLAAQQGDTLAEAACANNLAVAYAASGRHARARAELERALRLYQIPRTQPADLGPLSVLPSPISPAIPLLRERLTPEQRAAVDFALQFQAGGQPGDLASRMNSAAAAAWRRADSANTRSGAEIVNLNLGNLALAMGQLGEAQAQFQRAFDSHPAAEAPSCRAAAAMDLARVYWRLNRRAESQRLLERYRPGEQRHLAELGTISLAAVDAAELPPAAGNTPALAPNPSSTPQRDGSAAFSLGETAGRLSEASLTRLLAQAGQDASQRPPQQAWASWQRLAVRAAAGQRPDLGFSAHAALMRLHAAQGEAALAAYHGKSAANLAQATRADLAEAAGSRQASRAFLRERRQVYVGLAQLLMDRQRLAEAEAVLQLMKEDEGQQFSAGQGAKPGRLALTRAEQARQRLDDDAAALLRQADQARLKAVSATPIAGALLKMGPADIEIWRLKHGLALADLPAQLKRKPLLAFDAGLGQTILRDMRAFFLGPQRQAEAFLKHLIEDIPYFVSPVSERDRRQLADNLQRLPQILAEMAPLLSDEALEQGPGISISVGPGNRESDQPQAVDYVGAAPMERLWRSLHEFDVIEARQLQRIAAPEARVGLGKAEPPEPAAPADDTVQLLARQAVPTALLYYLPGDDRLDLLMVSGGGRRHLRLAGTGAALEASVRDFVALLRHTERDPRPAAQALYQRLFAPVAQAVADSGAQVLALSLASGLRFLPFAALHDGERWLVERYALALHPGGSLAGRLKPASPNWRAVAFGASAGGAGFAPLLNVRSEIASVVRQGAASGGVLSGEAWLDQGFTAQRLRTALAGRAELLHIASHFKFVAGDAAASYLLLGDGGRLSLRDLAGPEYPFHRTELVTLSACTTGLSADDVYGQEVDGLAALLMGQGAPSVLASLWDVNDRTTATLMAALYRLREDRRLSRALALQQAQVAMIGAAAAAAAAAAATAAPPATGPGKSPARGVVPIRLPGDPEPDGDDSAFAPPASLGAGHPFYWAPFVLMGNWL